MYTAKKCRYGFQIYNTRDQFIGKSFAQYGEYAESEVSIFKRIVKEGDCVIDVGACVGSHTVPFCHLVGKSGIVLAFEPEKMAFFALCGTMALNNFKQALCFQQAVGAKEALIKVPELDEHVVTNFGGTDLRIEQTGYYYSVPVITIDSLLRETKIHLIKIDVEGMEIEVIQGALQTINKYRPTLYVDDYSDEQKSAELHRLIENLGYNIHKHVAPVHNDNNYYEEKGNHFIIQGQAVVSINLLCLPQEEKCPFTKEELALLAGTPLNLDKFLMGQQSCVYDTRIKNNDFGKYLLGNGIDIGSGCDPLKIPMGTVRTWDLENGDTDARYMEGIPDNTFDFVHSSHCLEHLTDVGESLKNWIRILKPGGILFVAVPDWKLYEHERWPSQFNPDHKYTFSIDKKRDDVKRLNHFNIHEDIKPILEANGVELLEVRLEDDRYDHSLPTHLMIDQTGFQNAVAQVTFIGRKALPQPCQTPPANLP